MVTEAEDDARSSSLSSRFCLHYLNTRRPQLTIAPLAFLHRHHGEPAALPCLLYHAHHGPRRMVSPLGSPRRHLLAITCTHAAMHKPLHYNFEPLELENAGAPCHTIVWPPWKELGHGEGHSA